MELAKYKAPMAVATAAVGVYMYTEYLNWYVYKWVLSWSRLAPLRDNRWVKWGISMFSRLPFTTVVIFAATPLPFWVVRSVAILKPYSVGWFMLATALGRWPRFFAYAWLGEALQLPLVVILGFIVVTCAAAVAIKLARREALLADAVLDGDGETVLDVVMDGANPNSPDRPRGHTTAQGS
jgi:uncharacterized membrane protein YdjX (TVP38/TMEM64 family)